MSGDAKEKRLMETDLAAVRAAALALPEYQRAQLAAELLDSIDERDSEKCDEAVIDAAWIVEAERRYQAYKRGEMGSIPIEQVLAKLR